jgi:hypothetical protein
MSKVVYVELLCDVGEGGVDLAKAGEDVPLKVTQTKRGRIGFHKGLVVTMTEEGADKWVKRGIAKVVPKPTVKKSA